MTRATLSDEEVERRLDLMRTSIAKDQVRCPWCESTQGQLNGPIVEGEEYLERNAWCTFCAKWHVTSFLEKPVTHPLDAEDGGGNQPPGAHDRYEELAFDAWLDAFMATGPRE